MKNKLLSGEQMESILREADTGGKSIVELCRTHGISDVTFCAWRRKFGQMYETAVRRPCELEMDNFRLKRFFAERGWRSARLRASCKKSSHSPGRRQAVGFLFQQKISRRKACDLAGARRGWMAYVAKGEEIASIRLLCGTALRNGLAAFDQRPGRRMAAFPAEWPSFHPGVVATGWVTGHISTAVKRHHVNL